MASEHLENFKNDVTCSLNDVIPGPVIAKDKVSQTTLTLLFQIAPFTEYCENRPWG